MSFRTRRGLVAAMAIVAAGAFVVPAMGTSGPAVDITMINGQDASGGSLARPVTGDTITATGTATTNRAVIADAGASSAVPRGSRATLVGLASYGVAPYTFAWTFDGVSERFADPHAATTTFDTSGLPTGPVTVDLAVTDARGSTDTDTVLLFVQDAEQRTVLAEQQRMSPGAPDELVGVSADGATQRFEFDLPAGATDLALDLDWTDATNDLDLRVDDPSDAEDENATGATGSKPEHLAVAAPAAGTWAAIVEGFTNTPDELILTGTVRVATPDPTPVLRAGPYRFEEGAPQELTASVVGGAAPALVTWDLDGDDVADATGTSVVTGFPFGTHLVTVKVTDAAGYEKRETVPVKVVAAGVPSEDPGLVVVAVADSGVNVYHDDFRASTFPDQRILQLTRNFTRHPSEYLPGYPKDAARIDLTLGDEYYPAADRVVDPNDGRTTLPEVQEQQLYWIPGTKIIGARDNGDAAFVNSTAGDDVPLLDEDGHGTGSASVAVGNLYGYCPTCLLVMTESSDEAWEYGTPWIDLASNSFGAAANVGSAGTIFPPSFPRVSAERGQIALYAAGNGNENAFITPEQTYTSESLGPDWSIRVGAVTTGSRKPVVGTGKPVDIASYGSGDIPAAAFDSVHGLGSHSGTSAATPYSAGVFGTVLQAAREALGDTATGQRPGYGPGVIARGARVPGSPYLYDGILTRTELVDIVFKTAEHDPTASFDAEPLTTPDFGEQHLLEGYGVVDRASAARAREVLLGWAPLPLRPTEDEFFAQDEQLRDELWGDWAGGGHDSSTDVDAPAPRPRDDQLAGVHLGAELTSPGEMGVTDPVETPLRELRGRSVFPVDQRRPVTPTKLFLHRTGSTTCADGRYFLDRVDRPGDQETACALQAAQPVFEPAGLGFLERYGVTNEELPAYLTTAAPVTGTIYVSSTTGSVQGQALPTTLDRPSPLHTLRLRLLSGDQVIGSATVTKAIGRTTVDGPTPFPFSFAVAPAFAGRPLGDLALEIVHDNSIGAGKTVMEGPLTSSITAPFVAPADRQANAVEVSVDDPDFRSPIPTTLAADGVTFSGALETVGLADGRHHLYTRARQGSATSAVLVRTIEIRRSVTGVRSVVQAQVTAAGVAPTESGWSTARDLSDDGSFSRWTTTLGIRAVPKGTAVLRVRVLDGSGAVTAADAVYFTKPKPAA